MGEGLVDIFDGSSGLWSTAALLVPHGGFWGLVATSLPIQGLAIFASVSIDNDYMYYSDVNIFDGNGGRRSVAGLSVPRQDFAATSLPSQSLAFFAGGSGSNVVDIFDGNSGRWSTAGLSVARSGLAATSLPNQGLAIFGGGADGLC